MSYRAGLWGESQPTLSCDSLGCETKIAIDGVPPRWFIDNRARRGWYMYRNQRQDGSIQRIDYCPHHKHLAHVPATRKGAGEKKGRK